MQLKTFVAATTVSLALVACQKSEISDKPAAQVSESTTTTAAPAATTGAPSSVIKDKSRIDFVGAKITRDHKGGFRNFDGGIVYAQGQPESVNFTIDMNSIYVDEEKLTGHLKTPDFFDVAKYPQAKFTSTSLTAAPAGSADGSTHILKGTLEMHGMSKEITIPVKAVQSADGVRTTSEFTINRHDWGINYKGAADDLIKDNVLIKLDLMFPPPPAA